MPRAWSPSAQAAGAGRSRGRLRRAAAAGDDRPGRCHRGAGARQAVRPAAGLARQRGALRGEMNADQPCLPIEPAAPRPRRSRQARVVWGSRIVTVGGDAPVRVQSMTNTDTAGRDRHGDPGQGTGGRRLRAGAHHGQHARGRGAGALHPRAARSHGHRRAADRRLPLQRPPPAHRLSGLRRRRCPSTASTPATWARATSTTGSSAR